MIIRFLQNTVVALVPEYKAGETYEVEDAMAHLLVSRGQAELVDGHAPKKEEPRKTKKSLKS